MFVCVCLTLGPESYDLVKECDMLSYVDFSDPQRAEFEYLEPPAVLVVENNIGLAVISCYT